MKDQYVTVSLFQLQFHMSSYGISFGKAAISHLVPAILPRHHRRVVSSTLSAQHLHSIDAVNLLWCYGSLWHAMAECQFFCGIQFANVKLLSDRTNVTRISYETKRIWTRLEIEELRWLQVVLEGKVFSDYQHISVSPLWPCSSNRDKERDTFLLHGICSQSSRTIGSFLGFSRSICWTANTAQQASYSTLQYSTAEDLYWVNGKLQQNHVVDFITNDHESLWITIIIDWLTLTWINVIMRQFLYTRITRNAVSVASRRLLSQQLRYWPLVAGPHSNVANDGHPVTQSLRH